MTSSPATPGSNGSSPSATITSSPGLKKIPPYWYPYTTMAKERWLGREILEVVSTEFRDRSMEYYRYALESGVTTINGKVARPETIIRNGDRIENVVHRHEPPVTSTPVRIILHDEEREFIVIDKPGSIPVHASGRYFRNSLVEILKNDFGYKKVYTINRLDRLTSGLMIIPLSAPRAAAFTQEFAAGTIRKEYVARCNGMFPEEEVVCEEPLLTIDRQMGLNIVHPEGKPAKTIFKRIHYDANTDTSVVHCRPLTGRSHQIRVHLQYIGYPIANDPVYSETKIWGEKLGKGGLDLTPSDERSAPAPPEHCNVVTTGNPESSLAQSNSLGTPHSSIQGSQFNAVEGDEGAVSKHVVHDENAEGPRARSKLLPRETGHDIGMGSPVPLSAEMVGIITRLRNMKDEDEDWSRWRDVVFRAKGVLSPYGVKIPLPPQNRRKRGGPVSQDMIIASDSPSSNTASQDGCIETKSQLTEQEALDKLQAFRIANEVPTATERTSGQRPSPDPAPPPAPDSATSASVPADGPSYCPDCYLPLHPDPKPERLYIFLHALRYTTSLGAFETEMPEWAAEGWIWER